MHSTVESFWLNLKLQEIYLYLCSTGNSIQQSKFQLESLEVGDIYFYMTGISTEQSSIQRDCTVF